LWDRQRADRAARQGIARFLDGSARPYVHLIQQAEIVEQSAERNYLKIEEPVSISNGASSLIVLPHDGLKITCTSADDRGIHTQHLSFELRPDAYIADIAPARTFTIYEDIEPLLKMGKIQGGSLDCAIVIRGNRVLSKEPLRFNDEFVRHKILDILGDIALLGKPLHGHIVAVRPGHALNNKLVRRIAEQAAIWEERRSAVAGKAGAAGDGAVATKPRRRFVEANETQLGIRRILDILPHAFPFVMIDRIVEFISEDELRAIKNVTINEPFFQGHYPGNPVMPGVLQVEAMAQAAGIIMLRRVSSDGKVAFFMSADKVKFRRAVTPGDQLEIHVKLTKHRGNKIAVAEGQCLVDGKEVSSAELMFMIADAAEM
jgi:UDP-3-O-[3-hydroxymyristoyl] N-acetylglucosamine deacetylase/3-hydroxyacyl-[acyl-carrier-protein] dehydratase